MSSIEAFYEKHEPLRTRMELAGMAVDAGKTALDAIGARDYSDTSHTVRLESGVEVAVTRYKYGENEYHTYELKVKVAENRDGTPVLKPNAEVDDVLSSPSFIRYSDSRHDLHPDFDEARDRGVAMAFVAIREGLVPAQPTAGITP